MNIRLSAWTIVRRPGEPLIRVCRLPAVSRWSSGGRGGGEEGGETLTGVAWQTGKYLDGLPDEIPTALEGALPFAYQSTGVETRFTNTPAGGPRRQRCDQPAPRGFSRPAGAAKPSGGWDV
ncbi:MAG: hypothetical protein M3Q92_06675 [Actinomycetota bacterium]|nr:hypothetical protein [Actinomycetota bacterium]